jgi:hypothetical protein
VRSARVKARLRFLTDCFGVAVETAPIVAAKFTLITPRRRHSPKIPDRTERLILAEALPLESAILCRNRMMRCGSLTWAIVLPRNGDPTASMWR